MYARTSIVLYKDRSHTVLREYLKISKKKTGWGQDVLIVANDSDMLLVELNDHDSII